MNREDNGLKFSTGDEICKEAGGDRSAFTVQRFLGNGAFGEVHLVVLNDAEAERNLAMKCTKFGSLALQDRLTLFASLCDEALLMASLRHHPNLIALQHTNVAGEDFMLFVDLVEDSMELEKAYQKGVLWESMEGGKMGWTTPPIARISGTLALLWHQLLSALHYMHSKHIMHCDVKPENIMLNPNSLRLFLFDMGLARKGRLNSDGILEVDCTGCTKAYGSPEVLDLFKKFEQLDGAIPAEAKKKLHHEHPISPSSHDLWAAALTIFEGVGTKRSWVHGDEGHEAIAAYRSTHRLCA